MKALAEKEHALQEREKKIQKGLSKEKPKQDAVATSSSEANKEKGSDHSIDPKKPIRFQITHSQGKAYIKYIPKYNRWIITKGSRLLSESASPKVDPQKRLPYQEYIQENDDRIVVVEDIFLNALQKPPSLS